MLCYLTLFNNLRSLIAAWLETIQMSQLLSSDFQTVESTLKKYLRESMHWWESFLTTPQLLKKEPLIDFRRGAHLIKHFAEYAVAETLDNCRYFSVLLDKSLSNSIVSGIQKKRNHLHTFCISRERYTYFLRYSLGSTDHS